jgi:hypothetical protein
MLVAAVVVCALVVQREPAVPVVGVMELLVREIQDLPVQ